MIIDDGVVVSQWGETSKSFNVHSIRKSFLSALYGTGWVAVNGNRNPEVGVPDGSFSAWGAGGHFMAVIPALQLVVVHRVDTQDPEKKVTPKQFGKLLRLILVARKSSPKS